MDNITAVEVYTAIKPLKNNKAPGIDEIPLELLKHGHNIIVEHLTNLLNNIWNNENIPVHWTKVIIVKVPKKGNLSGCNKWWGITLLSVMGKVFSWVLLRQLQGQIDLIHKEEQAGFRNGPSCTKQIFKLQTSIEQCPEH